MIGRLRSARSVAQLLFALVLRDSTHRHGIMVARADFTISTNQQHVPSSTESSQSACTNDAQCLNGGTCTTATTASATTAMTGNSSSHNYQRLCECPSGYGGSHCQDHCPLKCQNGGYCQLVDSRDPTQYRSSNLESRYDNGYSTGSESSGTGTSTTSTASYQCKCRGLYSGKLCNVPYTNCPNSRKCYNGGTCVISSTATSNSYCSCPDGYGGSACDQAGDMFTASTLASSNNNKDAGRSAGIAVAVLMTIAFAGVAVATLVVRMRRRRRQHMGGRRHQPSYKTVHTKDGTINLRPHPELFWESEGMPSAMLTTSRPSSTKRSGEEEAASEIENERDPLRLAVPSHSFGNDSGDDKAVGITNDDHDDDPPEARHRWRNIV